MDLHEKVAELSLNHFKNLPKTGKPQPNTEWTVLSTIVQELDSKFDIVALGTGSKCIGITRMCPNGTILNDSHAEVICRRNFLRYIYEQMLDISEDSILQFNKVTETFNVRDGVKFHFFTTRTPCGDAAIFPKPNHPLSDNCGRGATHNECDSDRPNKKRKLDDATLSNHTESDIFRTGAKCIPGSTQDPKVDGAQYHVTGVVRTKPGRGDPTLSISCSDKIARWCHLGIQGALLSILLESPIYLNSFTITGDTPFSYDSFHRAVYGRLNSLAPITKLVVKQVRGVKFEHQETSEVHLPCPSSVSWAKVNEKPLEVAVDGKKQGVTKKVLATSGGALKICKLNLFRKFKEVVISRDLQKKYTEPFVYKLFKDSAVDYQEQWRAVKQCFNTWTQKNNEGLLSFRV